MTLRPSLSILVVILATCSCAELKIDDVSVDTEDVVEDIDNDALLDVEDTEVTPADTDGETDVDDASDSEDGETADFCPDDAEPCNQGDTRCGSDGRSLQSCNAVCGAYLQESTNACDTGELCYENELGADCTPPPFSECDPLSANADVCVDSGAFAPCQRDGSLGVVTDCSSTARCADGVCRTPIIATGAACNNSGDCNDFCLCGAQDYNPRSGVSSECSQQPLLRGFCTVDNCLRDGCLEDEACAMLSQSDFANGKNICLATDTCSGQSEGDSCLSAGRVGFTCRNVPVEAETEGQVTWTLACYDSLPKTIGETCRTSGECLGSTCKRRSTASVCSQSCISDANCVGDSVCVYNPDEIDVSDSDSQSGISSGLCLFRSTACDGTDDVNVSLVSRITRTFDGQAGLLSVCYLDEQ